MKKVSIPLNGPEELSGMEKDMWKRKMSFIPRPILIVTTISKEGVPNAGLKTNFTIVSSLGKIAFVCSKSHDTYKNILDTKEFVVNIPTEEIISQTFMTAIPFPHNVNEIEKAGLTAIPSEKVKPPRIKECKAHFECVLDWLKEEDDHPVMIVGRVVAASADEDIIGGKELKTILTSGGEGYGIIGETKKFPRMGGV